MNRPNHHPPLFYIYLFVNTLNLKGCFWANIFFSYLLDLIVGPDKDLFQNKNKNVIAKNEHGGSKPTLFSHINFYSINILYEFDA